MRLSRWLTVLLILWLAAVPQVNSRQARTLISGGATLPATCVVTTTGGEIFWKTGASNGLYQCLTTNTWTKFETGAGTGTVTNAVTLTAKQRTRR